MAKTESLAAPFRITDGRKSRLKDIDPAGTGGIQSKADAEELLVGGVEHLSRLQEKLYAQNRWGLLLIFQAMDAAGKDGAIEHVMTGINPQGVQVYSFKAPSAEELNHDYLWRTTRCLPERGRIGIFNRSYYEEVLVVRVHPELLDRQKMPPRLVTKKIWNERFEDINAFETYLTRNGIVVRKFFLHVSKEEQRQRLLGRLEDPRKNWKFSHDDLKERDRWDEYMEAYEDMVRNTATDAAPWYVVPADHKWFTRLVVAEAIAQTLEGLKPAFPRLPPDLHKELDQARDALAG
jgi:PPK2 family polyphosphate:nucleotide phosphotransferase